jgi:flagellar biosynthetic protein FliQ
MVGSYCLDHWYKVFTNWYRLVLVEEREMTPESVMTLGRDAMEITLLVAAPILLVVLAIGLIVSIFQAATQINEATLSFIPKLVGVFAVLMFAGQWMLTTMVDYMHLVFTSIPSMAN